MKTSDLHARTITAALLGIIGLGAATGLAFAGWMEHGPGIFMSLIQSGLAWCF